VGTGILTMPVYRTLPDAAITCLDYSENMMGHGTLAGEHPELFSKEVLAAMMMFFMESGGKG